MILLILHFGKPSAKNPLMWRKFKFAWCPILAQHGDMKARLPRRWSMQKTPRACTGAMLVLQPALVASSKSKPTCRALIVKTTSMQRFPTECHQNLVKDTHEIKIVSSSTTHCDTKFTIPLVPRLTPRHRSDASHFSNAIDVYSRAPTQ